MNKRKSKKEILHKLGIKNLNQMQLDTEQAILDNSQVVLLSPTGTGKTLAFLLPILEELDVDSKHTQVLILVPSRELAIQIEQVTREMGSGFKANAVYGGRSGSKDKIELNHPPAILIGTPGRIADHLRRDNISGKHIKTIVLDEFDKSLEIGFEMDMKEIMAALPNVEKKVLTCATQRIAIPDFVGIRQPVKLNFLKEHESQLKIRTVLSDGSAKEKTLESLLGHLDKKRGIIFCNLKESLQSVSSFLNSRKINHTTFHGDLEQMDREHSLIKFRNGTHRLLLATDLAARGIDVPDLDFIIHYEIPPKHDEFIHRNGRTARMHSDGTAYLIKGKYESFPEFIKGDEIEEITPSKPPSNSKWDTLYITGGRKDKISKGDIAGLFFKQGKLSKNELGSIELKNDCAFVAVLSSKTREVIGKLNNSRLKKKKVRISLLP